jgi:hypothetical protein
MAGLERCKEKTTCVASDALARCQSEGAASGVNAEVDQIQRLFATSSEGKLMLTESILQWYGGIMNKLAAFNVVQRSADGDRTVNLPNQYRPVQIVR